MPDITSTFVASFDSFYGAVDKAVVTLKAFEAQTENVDKAMNRMGDSFSGRKLIQNATMAAEAIDKIGGVSILTDKELQRLAAQSQEAAEKMNKLGIGVPENLQKIIDANASRELEKIAAGAKAAAVEVEKVAPPGVMSQFQKDLGGVKGAVGGVVSAIGPLAATVGIGFSVGAVVGFGKSLLDTASTIANLSTATGVAMQDLQRFGYVGAGAGIDTDEFGRAVGTLSERLAGGDASASAAVQQLGLNVQALIAAGPTEAFISIGEAVARVEDPMQRNALAADLFGGKLSRELIPALGGLRQAMEDVPDDALIGDAQIKAADDFGRALDELTIKAKAWGFEILKSMGFGKQAVEGDLEGTVAMLEKAGIHEGKVFDMLAEKRAKAAASQQIAIQQTYDYYEKLGRAATQSGFVQGMTQGSTEMDALHESFRQFEQQKYDESLKRLGDRLREIDPGVVTFKVVSLTDAVRVLSTEPVFVPLTDALRVLKTEGVTTVTDIGTAFTKLDKGLADIEQRGIPAVFTQGGLGTVGEQVKVATVHVTTFTDRLRGGLDDAATILNNIGGKFAEVGSIAVRTASAMLDRFSTGDWIGGIVAGATGAISAITKIFSNAEKQINPVREAFVQAAGGLGELNVKAQAAGLTLDKLLNAKNPKQYQAAIDELNAAFTKMDKRAQGASRFGPSKKELDQLAADAKGTYDYMVESGQYSAEQIAAAFKASNDAQLDGLGVNTKATTDHLNALQKGLDELTSKREALWQDIASEAPEEVMGVVEAGQRAQLAVLDDQIEKQKADIAQQALDAAAALEGALSSIKPDAVGVPFFFYQEGPSPSWNAGWTPPAVPGFAGGTHGRFVNFGSESLVRLHGEEAIVPKGETTTLASGGSPITITINAQGAFFDTPGSLQQLADKVSHALTAKYGLTNRLRAA